MRKNKMLFVFERYKYNDNKVSTLKNLSFLSIISFIIIISLKFTIKNSNEESFDVNFSKNIKKKLISTLRALKKKMIQKLNLLNIVEIDVSTYYYLARNKENKLFFLIINEIYNTLIESFETLLLMKRDNRISINDSYLCNFRIKYKKCYKFYMSKSSQINNIKILIS